MNARVLRLYVAGNSAVSRRAIQNLGAIHTLAGMQWDVRVIDVLAQPELAEQAGIFVTPTLSYDDYQAPRRLIGDLDKPGQVLIALGITSPAR